jgi:UTP--glucose-1-phosphate uridylyltransferase
MTKAVIPAAGMGTRFLPATKAIPKEMLPLVDKPAIQFVVEEAVHAGSPEILMITGRNKNALENHFDRAVELEDILRTKGDVGHLEEVESSTQLANIHYVRQHNPLGLGHAILRAQSFVGDEPFAVLLGDDILVDEGHLLSTMKDLAQQKTASVVALIEVDEADVSKYGIAGISEIDAEGVGQITTLVEKPDLEEAPSRYAVIGRYILQPQIFDALGVTAPGRNGEIQLTDALAVLAADPETPVWGIVYRGERHDTGDKLSYLKAVVTIGSRREDLGADFRHWIKDFSDSLED